MDPFYIAAFVASSKLNDLSQNAPNVVSKVVLSHHCINTISGPFSFFTSPKNGLNLPTLLTDAVLILTKRHACVTLHTCVQRSLFTCKFTQGT